MELSSDAGSVERQLAAYYDQEAEDRANRPLDHDRVEARSRFTSRLDPVADRLLEIGIGPGRDAQAFASAGVTTCGVDLSVEHARRATATGAHVCVASVRALPFEDSWFTAIWTMSTLMHVPNAVIADALSELRRVLALGGVAAIGVWGGPDIEHRSDRDRYDPPRFFSRRSDSRWRGLLKIVGTVEQFNHWGGHDDLFWYQFALISKT